VKGYKIIRITVNPFKQQLFSLTGFTVIFIFRNATGMSLLKTVNASQRPPSPVPEFKEKNTQLQCYL
jgi:hypothetical protein